MCILFSCFLSIEDSSFFLLFFCPKVRVDYSKIDSRVTDSLEKCRLILGRRECVKIGNMLTVNIKIKCLTLCFTKRVLFTRFFLFGKSRVSLICFDFSIKMTKYLKVYGHNFGSWFSVLQKKVLFVRFFCSKKSRASLIRFDFSIKIIKYLRVIVIISDLNLRQLEMGSPFKRSIEINCILYSRELNMYNTYLKNVI